MKRLETKRGINDEELRKMADGIKDGRFRRAGDLMVDANKTPHSDDGEFKGAAADTV